MLKFIILECLKRYLTEEKKCYSSPVANSFAVISLVMLGAANYFYLQNLNIGDFLIYSTAFLALALVIKAYSWCVNKPKPVSNGLPNLAVRGVEKITPYLPAIISFIPVGMAAFAAFNLVKGWLQGTSKV